jgi:hypothetical protein
MQNRQTAHWLDPQIDYVEYDGASDLVAKVERYLQNDAERERVARQGCRKAHALYTASRFWESVFSRTLTDRMPAQVGSRPIAAPPAWCIDTGRFSDRRIDMSRMMNGMNARVSLAATGSKESDVLQEQRLT